MIIGPRLGLPLEAENEDPGGDHDVIAALEEILLPALSQPPCKVAFSGGRDSSAILAVAAHIARRHGLPDPVPLTFHFDHLPRARETEWQELMVRRLRLTEWEIVPIQAEFDLLGPLGRKALLRHGLFWPPNVYTMITMLESAGEGSLVTGSGGDEVFSALIKKNKMTTLQMIRMLPPHHAVVAWIASKALPTRQQIRLQYHHLLRFPWLRGASRRELRRQFVDYIVRERASGRHPLRRARASRRLELWKATAGALSRDAGVQLIEPFWDPRFFRAVLSRAPSAGFPDRNAGLRFFFQDHLPEAVLERSSKAIHTESFWGPETRAFARRWDGAGLDPSIVDPEAIREHWLRPKPDMRAATPLQAAWLASAPGDRPGIP